MSQWQRIPFSQAIETLPVKNKIKNSAILTIGQTPVIDQSEKLIAGFTDLSGLYTNPPYIIFGDHTRCIKYIDFCFNPGADGVKILKVNNEYCDPRFVYEYLKFRPVQNLGYSRHFKLLKEITIPVPPLEKQAEIAEVLRNSAQQITLQQNSIKQTSSICSNYYSLIQKDNYPELSLMNAGITKTSGKSITAKGNDPHETNRVLKVNAVSSGSFKPEESKPLPKSYSPDPSHSVCYGDLLFARASGTAALLGACTIVDKAVDNIFLPDKIWNLHTNGSPISKFYLLEALRSNNFRKIAESQFSSSTGVKNIKTSVLMNFAVKVPPPDTLNKFNQVFKYTASIIQKQKEKLALLEELHQSLATRAFAGQL